MFYNPFASPWLTLFSALASVSFTIPQSAPLTCLGSRLGQLYNPPVSPWLTPSLTQGGLLPPASSAPLHMGAYKPSLCKGGGTAEAVGGLFSCVCNPSVKRGGPRKQWKDCYNLFSKIDIITFLILLSII